MMDRKAFIATTAIVCIVAATPAIAQIRLFDIPAQPLETAVSAFGKQADVQIIAPRRLTKTRRSASIRGNMSVEQALDQMLAGTGLVARATGAQTFAVVPAEASSPRSAPPPAPVSHKRSRVSVAEPQQETPVAAAVEDQEGSEIVVTGIRRSLRDSIDIKRNSVNVVDSIASEDLGKLPDQNVAESLQRIPGVAIDRNRGDGQFVSIRGLGPAFNTVTINGRTIATENVGREFSFDVLPSELISGADVYKSPTAQINGASIGATVNIRTVRPLDLKPFVLAMSGGINREVLADTWAPTASGLVSWHNDAGTFGVSLVGSYDRRKIRVDEFDVSAGFVKRGNQAGDYFAGRTGPDVAPFHNLDQASGFFPSFILSDKERIGFDGTVQFKPTDNLSMSLDTFYSKLNQMDRTIGLSVNFPVGTLVEQVVEDNAAVYQKYVNNTADEIMTRSPRRSETLLVGYNAAWKSGDFDLTGDVSYSRATRRGKEDNQYSTVRRTGLVVEYDRRTGSPIFDYNFYSPDYPNAATDVDHIGAHYENDGGSDYVDQTFEAKLDGVWHPGGGVTAYIGFAKENRKKTVDTIKQSSASQCAFCGGTLYYPMPSDLFHPTGMTFFEKYDGNILRDWIQYDPRALVDALRNYSGPKPAGFVGYEDPSFNPAGSSVVREHVNLGYLMFNIDSNLGNMPLSVNAGVRVEDTHFTSDGAAQTVLSAAPNGLGQNVIVLSPVVPIGFGGHYTDILPSMNIKLDLTSHLVGRFAASRVVTRPTLSDLSPAQSISSNPGHEQIIRGNPNLLPFRASQVEVGLEWYIDRLSMLSGALFYKNIDSFVSPATTPQIVDQITFQVTQPTNGKGATVEGVELGYRQVFGFLPAPLDGLGFQGSFTYVKSNADYTNAVAGVSYGLVGLSKFSYSAVGFYEKGPVQLRMAYTWRDRFLQTATGMNGDPVYFAPYGQLDASASFAINKAITIDVQALNLTDSNEFTYFTIPSRTSSYRTVGRRFEFGAHFRF